MNIPSAGIIQVVGRMKRATWVTLATFFVHSTGLHAQAPPSPAGPLNQASNQPSMNLGQKTKLRVEELAKISQARPLSKEEMIERSACLSLSGEFQASIELAQSTLGHCSDRDEKAGLWALIAQNYGFLGEYEQAGQSALEGQRLVSEKGQKAKLLASQRIVFFHESGNTIQEQIAKDHLCQLDDAFNAKPTMEPITATVIIVAMILAVTGGVAVVAIKANNQLDDKGREALVEIMKAYFGALGLILGNGGYSPAGMLK